MNVRNRFILMLIIIGDLIKNLLVLRIIFIFVMLLIFFILLKLETSLMYVYISLFIIFILDFCSK